YQSCSTEILHKGKAQRSVLKGPLRALRLCVLCILAPVMLIATPLYLRYHVYNEQVYPLGVSDMRLVDTSVSTTWCQKQIIRANTTFNAYLLSAQPDTKPDPVHISMTRELVLSNDMKEYWGFYLLKGSIVTVSSCVRWPGASMVMIKGHKHLKECAYLGDNSSEEKSKQFDDESDNVEDANRPATMVKKKDGVIVSTNNVTLNDTYVDNVPMNLSDLAITTKGSNVHLRYAEEIRRKQLKKLRKDHHAINQEFNNEKPKVKNQTSSEMFDEILNKLKKMGDKGTQMLEQLNKELANKTSEQNDEISEMQKKVEKLLKPSQNSSRKRNNAEPGLNSNKTAEEVGTKLDKSVDGGVDKEDETNSKERKDEMKLRHDRSRKKRFRSPEEVGRMTRELHEDTGEEENVAEELGVSRKMEHGIKYIRGRVNETTPNDSSKSEFWSSFSSSEERLMECEGLLLNLPLTPHRHCEPNYPHDTVLESNTVSYKIPSNGYYFFIYNSENEVQTNYLKIKFQLEKIIYNVSNAMASCTNETDACTLPLDFFSEQKVVLELPYNQNESTLNDEFLAISQCEPRTSLYLLCVVAVPVVIVMFAFQ
ncbi:hypothetical protein WDU94_014537, partial [Cyamophila willieti]